MNYTAAQLVSFKWFIRNIMRIDDAALPDDSIYIPYALSIAVEITNPAIAQASGLLYTQALNNLGGDNLINWAPDEDDSTFFTDVRKSLNIGGFVGGVISASNDETTGETLLTPDFLKGLTMANLQNIKTPYGRQYMAIAQAYGPVWGLT